jgi:lipopolysaccharide assembly protein A
MRFLSTVFWVLVAVVLVLFGKANWTQVTVKLWSDIVADVRLPILALLAFLIGWLPTWLIMRAKIWTLKRRIEALDRNRASALAASEPVAEDVEVVE